MAFVNWLVVGVGDVVIKRVLPAIASEPRSRLHGVVSRDPDKGRRYAARVWGDLGEALADPAVDAVYIATPVFLHAGQANAALRAGKHVLCEKPAALDHASAAEMVRTARAAGRQLGVAYFRRYYPKLLRARELIRGGAIGQPVLALATCGEFFPLSPQAGARGWFLDPLKAGSGPLYDIGSHRIDALNFLLGAPTSVSARLSNSVRKMPVEDCATALIDYESGARAIVDARWNTRAVCDDFRVVGTEGSLELTPLNGPAMLGPNGEERLPCSENRHLPCVANFVGSVLDGEPLACDAADCLAAAWVLGEAVKCSVFHRPISSPVR